MTNHTELYAAFVNRDAAYLGLFVVGIKSTGIYCLPTCAARKAKRENCAFFTDAQDAERAGFRACKLCRPQQVSAASHACRALKTAIDQAPSKRWREADGSAYGVNVTTLRRQFKRCYGMTFVAYARAQRLALAAQTLAQGETVIAAQLDAQYASASGFRCAFTQWFAEAPSRLGKTLLYISWLDTPLGPMVAIAEEDALVMLEFAGRKALQQQVTRLLRERNAVLLPHTTPLLHTLHNELADYFAGGLRLFTTPIALHGTEFQQRAWQCLQRIPYGTTMSYSEQAKQLGVPKAVRAVASANGANRIALVVPCHRVVASNGKLGGYAAGLLRKQRLLELEGRANNQFPS